MYQMLIVWSSMAKYNIREREWDITNKIYNTHNNNKIEETFGKVKDHHNMNDRYEDLPLEAQCSVDADWYTGEYKKQKGKQIPLALQYPSCSEDLIIHNKTITSNFYKRLMNAYVEQIFLGYLQQKNEWEDSKVK